MVRALKEPRRCTDLVMVDRLLSMTAEARRLRVAVETSPVAGASRLPTGASDAELAELMAAFPNEHLPGELLALLAVMNGTGELPMWHGDQLLDCAGIVRETASRRQPGGLPWCSAWTVIASEGWNFAAVLRGPRPVESSPVVDLSYGNQDFHVRGATLTSLVAAAADVWEQGLFNDPAEIWAGWSREAIAVIEQAERRYPGESGLCSDDSVAIQPSAWPRDWPDRIFEPDLLPGRRVQLAELTNRPHAITVDVLAREGRTIHVADASGTAWADLPPAFDPDDSALPGTVRTFVVNPAGRPVQRDPRVTLRIQGVLADG